MQPISTDALVLVDKPTGVTSFDAVRVVARALGTRKAGHTGTLDPGATGLLVILAGRGTRLIRFVPGEPKVYLATMRFGEERDTDDAAGVVTRLAPLPDLSALDPAILRLTGLVDQRPPDYSAKKIEGRRAYALARKGETPNLAPAQVRVDQWEVIEVHADSLVARVTCSRGTYIRALARDLGRLLHSAAHLQSLRREASGPFSVRDAVTWDAIGRGELNARPLETALGDVVHRVLTPDEAGLVAHGRAIAAHSDGPRAALLSEAGELVAVARRDGDCWQPEVVLATA